MQEQVEVIWLMSRVIDVEGGYSRLWNVDHDRTPPPDIGLWAKPRIKADSGSKLVTELPPKYRCELGSPITDHVDRETMELEPLPKDVPGPLDPRMAGQLGGVGPLKNIGPENRRTNRRSGEQVLGPG